MRSYATAAAAAAAAAYISSKDWGENWWIVQASLLHITLWCKFNATICWCFQAPALIKWFGCIWWRSKSLTPFVMKQRTISLFLIITFPFKAEQKITLAECRICILSLSCVFSSWHILIVKRKSTRINPLMWGNHESLEGVSLLLHGEATKTH